MKTSLILAPAWLLIWGTVGCQTAYDEWDDCSMRLRDSLAARSAWNESESFYEGIPYESHFAKGFRAGYVHIMKGGNGCPPILPPRCYWGVHYQNAEGSAKVANWFNGFSHGVVVAEQDGVREWTRLPVMLPPTPSTPPPILLYEEPVPERESNEYVPVGPALTDGELEQEPFSPQRSRSYESVPPAYRKASQKPTSTSFFTQDQSPFH